VAEAGAGIRHREVRANGLRFHVAECGEGERLALLLHGFPECWYSWRHQLPLLARLGYRAWAPDLRGYGTSDRPPRMQDYALEALVADVAGLAEAAEARPDLLVGHDWGALVAWQAAMERAGGFERLAIMNVPHPGAARDNRSLRQLARSWYILFFQLPWLPEKVLSARGFRAIREAMRRTCEHPERFSDADAAVYASAAAQPGALTAMLNYYRALVRGGGVRRKWSGPWPTIEIPTLLVWGEKDVALGKELTYGTERYAPDLTLRYLPDSSHWVQQDSPDAVNVILEAWLTGQPVPEPRG